MSLYDQSHNAPPADAEQQGPKVPRLWVDATIALVFMVLDSGNIDALSVMAFLAFFLVALFRLARYMGALIRSKSAPPRALLMRLWMAPVCYVLAFVGSHAIQTERVRRSEVAGMRIVAALEKYHDETGDYPAELGELEPAYMARVPTTALGFNASQPFRYFYVEGKDTSDSDSGPTFVLGFDFQPGYVSSYSQKQGGFVRHD